MKDISLGYLNQLVILFFNLKLKKKRKDILIK